MNEPMGSDGMRRMGWVGCHEMERLVQLRTYAVTKVGFTPIYHHSFHGIGGQLYRLIDKHRACCTYCQHQSDQWWYGSYQNYRKGQLSKI
jgi:hypothetical protein